MYRLKRSYFAALVFALMFLVPTMTKSPAAVDTSLPTIQYTLRFPAPQTHYVEVEAFVPTAGKPDITLMMPVWTPGSYLVREYARHVEHLAAYRSRDQGPPLAVEKVRKNRWKIQTDGAGSVVVHYRVYAREMGVQSNWIDSGFAILNGAATFLTLADDPGPRPHEVCLRLPDHWKASFTGLPDAPGTTSHHYRAPDFDTLVDSPIYAGSPAVYTFEVDGKPHYLVNEGECGVWDGPRSAKDVEAIVRAQRDFWGHLPYDRYVFFNLLTETGGGLEHQNSTVLMASRWATRNEDAYRAWLNLVSHEYFHTWNVKRLRPAELGPFDYENEVYTKNLWVAEGITSYYDRIFVRRAGLCTDEQFLSGDPPSSGGDQAKNDIERLHDTPGRLVQPLEQASFDAWIKHYRRDENTPNTAISYYVKGSVVAWLLDARIRRLTDDKKSLDDVMRLLYDRHAGERGFTTDEFRQAARDAAGSDLDDFFHTALETTDELDYSEALDWFGLRFAAPKSNNNGKDARPKPWLGLETKNDGGRLVVSQVKRDTPALATGFNVGDEILAIGDLRVRPDQWSKRLELFKPGESLSILVARRDHLQRLEATLAPEPLKSWKLEPNPNATPDQVAHRNSWLRHHAACK